MKLTRAGNISFRDRGPDAGVRQKGYPKEANGVSERLFSWGTIFVFCLLIFPLLTVSTPPDDFGLTSATEGIFVSYGQYAEAAIVISIISINAIANITSYVQVVEKNVLAAVFTGLQLMILAASLATGNLLAAGYAVLFLAHTIYFSLFWTLSPDARQFVWKSIRLIVVVFLAIASALYWPPNGRYMGGIHPNNFSQLLILLACLAFYPKLSIRWTVGLLLIAISYAMAISSRYALLAIFVTAAFATFIRVGRIGNVRIIIAPLIAAILGIMGFLFKDSISSLFLLQDSDRGLASGMSGRTDLWSYALPQLVQHPFLGFGFKDRSAYVGTHNGLIDILLQVGLPTGIMLLAFVAYKIFASMRDSISLATTAIGDDVALATMFSIQAVVSAFFQPQLFNFGDVQGIAVLLGLTCLAAPRRIKTPRKGYSLSKRPFQRP
jgi:O-antigen ligase